MGFTLSMVCDKSVVFSWYSGVLHQKTGLHDISEIFFESGVKHYIPKHIIGSILQANVLSFTKVCLQDTSYLHFVEYYFFTVTR